MANIIPFRPVLPDLNDIISFDDFFGTAKRKFPLYYRDGYYQMDQEPSLLIYRIIRHNRSHTGIIACTHVEDYIQGHIKRHEFTLADKEARMQELFEERNGVIKPILLTYPNVLEIDALINRITISMPPSFKIPFEDDQHVFWLLKEEEHVQRLQELFKDKIPSSYICDGHHRMTTAERLYAQHKSKEAKNPYHYIMAAYFPASEILIHNYNRILKSLKGLSEEEFLQKLEKYYEVSLEPMAFRPLRRGEMGCYIKGRWRKLILKEEYSPGDETSVADSLDVHLFNRYILQDILGIEDVRNDVEVRYVGGVKGPAALERKVDEESAVAAFNLYPVAMEDLISISDLRGTLPPKSTYVEPRMRNGFTAQMYSKI
ncbi:DUF1015 family protein [Saprospira grandis]|uniref:DUF1015 domain-containing protein n=1 Tax=Saprospira grandis (strain Lewin) TaxID=984262 RepID=H6KZG4_SAPGL|nr:DUF1015 family protein [Saprospira grandis]AFC25740.1 hypothetical protein SGRA_3012 [Saprospira grandis str. Lewin]